MDGGQCVASMDTVGLANMTVDGKNYDLVPLLNELLVVGLLETRNEKLETEVNQFQS